MALTEQDLQEISTLLNPLQNDIQDMRQDIYDMKQDMHGMKLDMRDMSKRLTSLEVHIENETDRNIQRLAESQLDIIKKLNNSAKTYTTDLIIEIELSNLKSRISRLEENRS